MLPEFDFLVLGKNGQHLTNIFLNCFSLVPFGFSVGLFSVLVAAFDLFQLVVWRGCHPQILEPQLADLPQLMNFLKME